MQGGAGLAEQVETQGPLAAPAPPEWVWAGDEQHQVQTEQLCLHGRTVFICAPRGIPGSCSLGLSASSSPSPCPEASMDQIVEMGSWCLLLNCDLVIFKPPVLSTVLAPQSLVPRSLSLQNPALSPGLCWGELSLGSSCP